MVRKKKRQQRLERTITHIQHKWGQEAIRRGEPRRRPYPHIRTGFPTLDSALDIGGIPRGQITTLTGTPTSGKVTLAALMLAQAQAHGRPVAYIDLPHTCDADYLQRCGVRLRDLLVARPRDSFQALDMFLQLTKRVELAAILFDHWQALSGNQVQKQAEKTLDRLAGSISRSQLAVLVLDESPSLWQRFLSSGDILAHHTALRLHLSRERWFFSGSDVRGYQARVTIEKSKFGPEGKTVPIAIEFNGTVHGAGI